MRVQRDGDRAYASILQEPARFGNEVDQAAVLAAVGLNLEDAHPGLRPQLVSTGLATLIAPVASADAASRARSDPAAVAALADSTFNLYLCAIEGETARARSFMSELANEDPATGSAAGPLLAYANARLGAERLTVTQGVETGRPAACSRRWRTGAHASAATSSCSSPGRLRLP